MQESFESVAAKDRQVCVHVGYTLGYLKRPQFQTKATFQRSLCGTSFTTSFDICAQRWQKNIPSAWQQKVFKNYNI